MKYKYSRFWYIMLFCLYEGQTKRPSTSTLFSSHELEPSDRTVHTEVGVLTLLLHSMQTVPLNPMSPKFHFSETWVTLFARSPPKQVPASTKPSTFSMLKSTMPGWSSSGVLQVNWG